MHDRRLPRGRAAPDISGFARAAIPKSVPRLQFFRGLHVEIAPEFSSQYIDQPAGRRYGVQQQETRT